MSHASPIRSSSALDRLGITLRTETDGDLASLETLYASTRADEMAALPWPETVKSRFVADQFTLQRRHYLGHYPAADRWIVVARDSERIGRLYIDRSVGPWRLVDVTIDPLRRGDGVGTALLRWLMREGRRTGIDLHVAHDNPRAAALYARLGFVRVDSGSQTHDRMLWAGRIS